MKTFYLIFCVFFASSFNTLRSQCSVVITGDTCSGGTITASYSGPKRLKELVWRYNGNIAYTASITGFNPEGITVGTGINFAASLYVDSADNVYLCDLLLKKILKFSPGSTTPVIFATTPGYPNDVFFYKDTMFTAEGNIVEKWAPGATNGQVIAGIGTSTTLISANGVYVDNHGTVFIADGKRILKILPGSQTATTIISYHPTDNNLNATSDVRTDSAGNVYVLDADSGRVQKWAPGATKGITVAGGNGVGNAVNQINGAYQMDMDKAGNIFLQEQDAYRVSRWSQGASVGVTVAGGWNIFVSSAVALGNPRGVALDKSGNVFVGDNLAYHNRVQKFVPSNQVYKNIGIAPGNYTVTATSASGNTCIVTSSVFHVGAVPGPPVINGPSTVAANEQGVVFSIDQPTALSYNWTFPKAVTIVSGQGTDTIVVNWGSKRGKVTVTAGNACGTSASTFKRIEVSGTLIQQDAQSIMALEDKKLRAYPNPVHDVVNILWASAGASNYSLQIKDMRGKTLYNITGTSTKGNNKTSLNISQLAQGTYILYINETGEIPKTKKIIKQ